MMQHLETAIFCNGIAGPGRHTAFGDVVRDVPINTLIQSLVASSRKQELHRACLSNTHPAILEIHASFEAGYFPGGQLIVRHAVLTEVRRQSFSFNTQRLD